MRFSTSILEYLPDYVGNVAVLFSIRKKNRPNQANEK